MTTLKLVELPIGRSRGGDQELIDPAPPIRLPSNDGSDAEPPLFKVSKPARIRAGKGGRGRRKSRGRSTSRERSSDMPWYLRDTRLDLPMTAEWIPDTGFYRHLFLDSDPTEFDPELEFPPDFLTRPPLTLVETVLINRLLYATLRPVLAHKDVDPDDFRQEIFMSYWGNVNSWKGAFEKYFSKKTLKLPPLAFLEELQLEQLRELAGGQYYGLGRNVLRMTRPWRDVERERSKRDMPPPPGIV